MTEMRDSETEREDIKTETVSDVTSCVTFKYFPQGGKKQTLVISILAQARSFKYY